MNQKRNNYRHIAILGGSESGTGAALLAVSKGLRVFVSDAAVIPPRYKEILTQHNITFEEGGHSLPKLAACDLVIKSPGIPNDAAIIQQLHSVEVISEIEFASWFTSAYIIAVTGSNGKTTTSLLIGHLLKNAGLDVCVAGNVGKSFAAVLARGDHDYFVLELSSFQLDGIVDFKPDLAILTNITPDHLDRYQGDMQNYAASKMRITINQSDSNAFVFCADDQETLHQIKKFKPQAQTFSFTLGSRPLQEGASIEQNNLTINIKSNPFTMTLEELALQGKHNTYNNMAAGIAAKLIGIRNESIKKSLSDYQNIEHRLEYVANVHGISYYNDSKATNVNSTWYALESFNKPIVWIVGGVDKGNDYSILVPLVREKVKAIVCLGKDNSRIREAFGELTDQIFDADSAEQAVALSSFLASKNEIVLLSPACASFDLFDNYEDRGNQFKQAVKSL